MPHKHTRRGERDEKDFDLAPSRLAKPLPAVLKPIQKGKKPPSKSGTHVQRSDTVKRSKTAYKQDDTPRAFARLMQLQAGKRMRSGLDDGAEKQAKKRKLVSGTKSTSNEPGQSTTPAPNAGDLKIMPGEHMSDFVARVNQALPVSGLARKGKMVVEGVKERQTKTEKRLHKMYAEWHVEEAKRQEQLEEAQELEEEKLEDQEAEFGGQRIQFPMSRRAKRQRMVGEAKDDEDDPWAILKTKRERPKGLHDVVQAPPTIKAIPKEKFKVRNGAKVDVANVPSLAGSLKRREELGDARREVIERYRSMMKGNK